MSRSLDLEEILHSVLDKTLESLEIEAGGIYLLQEEEQILSLIGHRGFGDAESIKIDKLRIGEGYSGSVVQTGEPLIVRDIADDTRLTRQVVLEWGFRSLAVFPLVSRDRILGTLFVISKSVREFSQQDIELLTSIGRQSGAVVENAWLFAQAEQRLRELESLYTADERLYRHLNLDQVLQALVDVAVNILHADKSSFYVWNRDNAILEAGAACGFYPEKLQTMTYALGEGCVGKAAMDGKPMLVEDTASHPDVIQTFAEEEGIRSAMHLPISVAGDLFGVFNIFYAQPRAFGKGEHRLFKALVQRAALVIENAQLYEQTHEAAALQERQRLARELHDAVTQTLFSASLIAEVMPRLLEKKPEEGWKRLEELRQLTRGALAEMRTLLVELRPSSLIEAEFSDLLHQLAEASTGRTGVEIETNIEGEQEIPADIKVAFYRIAQEALNNVVKHAAASQVVVSLIQQPEKIRLSVQDNGRGFDPAEISSENLGLGIMRERVDAIGADLTIDTQIGRGTEVIAEWREHRS